MATSNSSSLVVFHSIEVRFNGAGTMVKLFFYVLLQFMELGFVWVCKGIITLRRKPAAGRYATMPSIDSVDLYSVGDELFYPISPWHLPRNCRNSRS